MRCDICGQKFDGPGVPYTRNFGKRFYVRTAVCPECATSRRNSPRLIALAICLALGSLGLIAFRIMQAGITAESESANRGADALAGLSSAPSRDIRRPSNP